MKVLHVTPIFYPATYWGGTIVSTYGLCNALATLPDIQLKVLTTDAAGPKPVQRVEVRDFPSQYPGGYQVYFTRRVVGREIAPGLLARLFTMVRWADIVHLTATYSFPTIPTLAVCRLLNKPVVWSPRGALQAVHEWKGASKPALKRTWEHICSAVMPRQCVLHVTSEVEKAASLARLPSVAAVVIPNGVNIPESLSTRTWLPGEVIRIMYIGRLDPKKGIENLLQAFGQFSEHEATLDIYGSGDSAYAAGLVSLGHSLGLDGRVRFHGHVDGAAKRSAFHTADVCVIPSHSENFGNVVAEALAHGVPVVASRGSPWAEVEKHGCGVWVDNTPEALAKAISAMRDRDLASMGEKGRMWMAEELRWSLIANRMCAAYSGLIGGC